MTSDRSSPRSGKGSHPSISETFGLHQYHFTKGKWLLLAVAALMVGLGVTFSRSVGAGPPPDSGSDAAPVSRQASPADFLNNSFAESSPSPSESDASRQQPAGSVLAAFSPFFVKGGFGIFIGFALGFAVRSFIRLATVILGFYFLALTLMAYAGWVEIRWDLMQEQFNHSINSLGEQLTSFQAFLTGAIPATGMTGLGLAFGLRKR